MISIVKKLEIHDGFSALEWKKIQGMKIAQTELRGLRKSVQPGGDRWVSSCEACGRGRRVQHYAACL